MSLLPPSLPCTRYHATDADLATFRSLVADTETWDAFGGIRNGIQCQAGIQMLPISPESDTTAMFAFWALCGTYGSAAVFAALAAAGNKRFHGHFGRDDPGALAAITAALGG